MTSNDLLTYLLLIGSLAGTTPPVAHRHIALQFLFTPDLELYLVDPDVYVVGLCGVCETDLPVDEWVLVDFCLLMGSYGRITQRRTWYMSYLAMSTRTHLLAY